MSLAQGFKEIVAYHMSLAQGLGSSFVLYVPSTRVQRDSCVPYIPGTRVKRCCLPYVPGKKVKEVLCYMSLAQGFMKSYRVCRCGSRNKQFLMEACQYVRLDLGKKSL